MLKLTTNLLLKNFILFIDNYFSYTELIVALKERGITIYRTLKTRKRDLSELLIEIKKVFIKNILYGVLIVVV